MNHVPTLSRHTTCFALSALMLLSTALPASAAPATASPTPAPAASAVAPASAASAPRAPLDLKVHFDRIDTNHDGRISLSELKEALRDSADHHKVLQQFDANGDGMLDLSEFRQMHTVPQLHILF